MNRTNKYGNTTLMVDVRNGKFQFFHFLKETHAYINIHNTKINTDLQLNPERNSVNNM
jgi:hypothetical protein